MWNYGKVSGSQPIIVTTSDPGHDYLDPSHAIRFRCERFNTWRESADTQPFHPLSAPLSSLFPH
jgi:hypothetical protein